MRAQLLLALTLIVGAPADAQSLTNVQTVSWVAPAQFVGGAPIPATVSLTYNVYAKLGAAAEIKLSSAIAATSITTAALPVGQSNCYTVTVLVNGANESDRSPEACGVVSSPKSKPVTTVVIQ